MNTQEQPASVGRELSEELGFAPVAWMCEFMTVCESTETQFVTEDPAGLRFNDAGDPSPFRVTPLYSSPKGAELRRLIMDALTMVVSEAELTPKDRKTVLDGMARRVREA